MPRIRAGDPTEGVQAVALALRVLEHLAQSEEPCGVTALANALNTTKNRIYRYLRTLVDQGYVVQITDTEKYRVGVRLIALGRYVNDQYNLGIIARDPMKDLRDNLGHFVCLSQIETNGPRVLASISGRSPVEIGVRTGTLLDFHSAAAGKVALAFGTDELRERVLTSRLEPRTPETITKPATLRKEIEQVRHQGWAIAPSEVVLGVNTLAAPVFDADGIVIATVAVVDSIQFIPAKPTPKQIRETVATARRISALLGYGGSQYRTRERASA